MPSAKSTTLHVKKHHPSQYIQEDIKNLFLKDNKVKNGTNSWALETIKLADTQAKGKWIHKNLTIEEIVKIILPHHNHGNNNSKELIPLSGLSVNQAVEIFKKERKNFDPQCKKKIEYFSQQESTPYPLFLSTRPIKGQEYDALSAWRPGDLIHLDGLHRMIGVALGGHIKSIPAYIAIINH